MFKSPSFDSLEFCFISFQFPFLNPLCLHIIPTSSLYIRKIVITFSKYFCLVFIALISIKLINVVQIFLSSSSLDHYLTNLLYIWGNHYFASSTLRLHYQVFVLIFLPFSCFFDLLIYFSFKIQMFSSPMSKMRNIFWIR